MSNKRKCPTCYLQSVPLLGSLRRVGHFWDTNLSGNGFSMSCDVWGEGMKKPSETSFQRVCLDCVLLCLRTLSGKRDSNSRPQPWQGCALPTELFPQLCYELLKLCRLLAACIVFGDANVRRKFENPNFHAIFLHFSECRRRIRPNSRIRRSMYSGE